MGITANLNLNELLQQGLNYVNSHPEHDLSLGIRQAIWSALGPRGKIADNIKNIGHKRRALLAINAVRHLLSLWKRSFPGDNTPLEVLAEAENVVKGEINNRLALAHYNQYWEHMDRLAGDSTEMAIGVGYAAVRALGTAIQDEFFDPTINYNVTDSTDIESNDATFFLASAYANGPVWQPSSIAARRREFWTWWLTNAVPAITKFTDSPTLLQ